MQRSLILAFLLMATLMTTYSQRDQSLKNINGKEIRGRELEWTDFTGEVDRSSVWNAYTDWVTSYRFSRPEITGGHARVRISVQLFLTGNSWVRPDRKGVALLEHERGHFNIGRICARQIERKINSTYFSKSNYSKEIDDAYWAEIRKCKEFEEQYDAETRHYNDRDQQAFWNGKIAELLKNN